MNIWYDTIAKTHLVKSDEAGRCHFCDDDFGNAAIHYRGWNKRERDEFLFCPQCIPSFSHKTPARNYWESRVVLLKDVIPSHCILVVNVAPTLKPSDSDVSVFEPEKLKSDVTVDKTKFAGRESVEGAQIGSMNYLKESEDRQIKNLKELDRVFHEHMKAMPLINDTMEDGRKLVEVNKKIKQ